MKFGIYLGLFICLLGVLFLLLGLVLFEFCLAKTTTTAGNKDIQLAFSVVKITQESTPR